MMKPVIAGLIALVAVFALSGCMDEQSPKQGNGQKAETATGQSNYDQQVLKQPAHNMPYSATRDTINFFIDTWGQKGKVAYNYLMNDSGRPIGYYVTEGLPVTMCASIRPNYDVKTYDGGTDGATVPQIVPAPSTDGVYYSGGQCNTYYAKDADNGAFLMFTVGNGMNLLSYDQPLAPGIVGGAPNLGNVK
jgi:hypothetical protein